MGQSTDAILFYGYHLPGDYEPAEDVRDKFDGFSDKYPIKIGFHCSGDYPMYYVAIAASEVMAYRGDPQLIEQAETHGDWEEMLRIFAAEHGLLLPGERLGPEPYDGQASTVGWWLASRLF